MLIFPPTLQPDRARPVRRVSGSKNPHFPSPSHRPEKGVFCKKSHFPCGPLRKKGDFLTENSHIQDEGKRGFLDPGTCFSRKWGFGPVWGRGNPNPDGTTALLCGRMSCPRHDTFTSKSILLSRQGFAKWDTQIPSWECLHTTIPKPKGPCRTKSATA